MWNRPWFERYATFNCGQQSVDFDEFVLLKEISMKYRMVLNPRLALMKYDLSSPFSLSVWDRDRLKGLQSQGATPLLQMINTTGKARCFSLVDKIYGVLSVCQEFDRRMMKVDYHICICCLLIWVAGYMLLRREADSPLSVFQTHQANNMHSLPSWVPD
jgi:hypothetical protein